jgi:cytochrome c oxidase assembly protein Cox11
MSTFKTERFDFETEKTEYKDGQKTRKTRFRVETEDIIAIFSGVVAVIFALGMVFGNIPINKLTIGVLGFSGAGVAIPQIIKAKNRNKSRIKQ